MAVFRAWMTASGGVGEGRHGRSVVGSPLAHASIGYPRLSPGSKCTPLKRQEIIKMTTTTPTRPRITSCASSSSSSPSSSSSSSTSSSPFRLWLAAAKPPMYTVAAAPILVAATVTHPHAFPGALVWSLLWPSLLVIAWLNLSNDVFDADTTVDATKAESVVNLLGGKARAQRPLLWLSIAILLLGLWGLVYASPLGSQPTACFLLAAAIACGYVYQGPPFRLSYRGLGEPLCFAAFGPLATTAFAAAMMTASSSAPSIPSSSSFSSALNHLNHHTPLAWMALARAVAPLATAVGLTTSTVLLCSHLHQEEGDRAAGKRSPVVRFGTLRVGRAVAMIPVLTYGLLVAAAGAHRLAWGSVVGAVALGGYWAWQLGRLTTTYHDDPDRVRTSKYLALRWHACLHAGVVLGRYLCPG